ncbi:MAG: ATP-binding protein [Planctomycetota bacterium]
MTTLTEPPVTPTSLVDLNAELNRLETGAHAATADVDWREVIDTCNDAYLAADATGRIVEWSDQAEELFGWRRDEILGQSLDQTVLPGDGSHGQRGGLALLAAAPVAGERIELTARRKDGSTLPAEVSVSSMPCDSSIIFSAFVHDISGRRELQTQLAHAQKLESIGQLSAGIAHEINTPTQYVGDNTRFLQDAMADLRTMLDAYAALATSVRSGGDTRAALAAVEQAAEDADLEYLIPETESAIAQSLEGVDRVARIVRAMKEFSHPGAATKTPTDLAAAIKNTITVATNEWKYHATIETDFASALPLVPCLPGDLNQVFLNLIVNGAHAIAGVVGDSGDKGVIRIAARVDGAHAVVTIADNGSGIPAEIVGRVFDPFFTTKDVGVGTGQGLAIARSVVVDKHGGTIGVESTEGVGTTFTIRLPLAD